MSEETLLEDLSAALSARPELAERLPDACTELKQAARRQLRQFRSQPSLNTTALVNETYLELHAQNAHRWNDRQHFLVVASMLMRHAENRRAAKRGHDRIHISVDDVELAGDERDCDMLLDLGRWLDQLGRLSERAARVVECGFFAGLTSPETAQALGVSEPTVKAIGSWHRLGCAGRCVRRPPIGAHPAHPSVSRNNQ